MSAIADGHGPPLQPIKALRIEKTFLPPSGIKPYAYRLGLKPVHTLNFEA
jgi:hypothetical protein